MVSFGEYYVFRQNLQNLAPFFQVSSYLISISILFSLAKKRDRLFKFLLLVSLFFCLAFFSVLFLFHLKIYNTVYLRAPFLQSDLRLFPPLWIETEKLFFWLMLTVFVSVPLAFLKTDRRIKLSLGFLLASFFIIVGTLNPFTEPLPELHEEIVMLEKAANSGYSATSIGYIINFFYRIKYFYHSNYMWIHPPLLFLSYAFFSVAFPLQLYMLFKKSENGLYTEKYSYLYTAYGYFFLTIGMLVGYPWAREAWANELWWWSPKINVSIMMWLFYTAYLHARIYRNSFLGRFANATGVLSFLALIFTYASTYFLPGVHSYG